MEMEMEMEPKTERVLPVLSQKTAAVQELVKSHTFGEAGAEMVAPCGLVSIAVSRWIAALAAAELDVACKSGWAAVEAALAPLAGEVALLPVIDRTAGEVLPRRDDYAAAHADELADDTARDAHRRGLIQPHEISAWLRSDHASDGSVVFMRNVQCGKSAAERVRFWPDLAALDADATLSAAEREWVREEGENDPSIDFLIETSASTEPVGFRLQTVDAWLSTRPRSGTPLILDGWGHYSVLVYLAVGEGKASLVLLDSMPVSAGELPTPQGQTLLDAIARMPERDLEVEVEAAHEASEKNDEMKADPDVAVVENGEIKDDPDVTLAEGRAVVGSLNIQDVHELRTYGKPPDALLHVCVTALLALSMPVERGWKDVQIGMQSKSLVFLKAVCALDPVGIDPVLLTTLSERMEFLTDKYTNKQMYATSKLGGALAVWLKAVVLSRSGYM